VEISNINQEKNTTEVQQEIIEDIDITNVEVTDEILNSILNNDLELYQNLMKNNYIRSENSIPSLYLSVLHNRIIFLKEILLNIEKLGEDINYQNPNSSYRTALHIASLNNRDKLVSSLLDAGADPSIKDMYNFTPYQLCKNKNVRQIFRKYAGNNPDKYDWTSLGVEPLTTEMELEQKKKYLKKGKEKNKKRKKKKISENNETLTEQNEEDDSEEETKVNIDIENIIESVVKARNIKARTLSDREKRALSAEIRIDKTQGKIRLCSKCGEEISILLAFEYETYQFCKENCLREFLTQKI